MVRRQPIIRPEILFLGLTAWLGVVRASGPKSPSPLAKPDPRAVRREQFSIDEILARPVRPRRTHGLHGRSRLGLEPPGLGVSRRRPLAAT